MGLREVRLIGLVILITWLPAVTAQAQSLGAHAGATDPVLEGWSAAHWVGEDLVLAPNPTSPSAVAPVMGDGGVDAWEIVDDGPVDENGGYARLLSPAEEAAITTTGLVIEVRARILENTGPNGARVLVVGTTPATTDARWVLALGADVDDDPMVSVQGGGTATLEGAGGGYHTYRLELDLSSSPLATVSVDGQTVLVDQSNVVAEGDKPRFVYFGSWSNSAVGGARYASVDFEVFAPPSVPSIGGAGLAGLALLLTLIAGLRVRGHARLG